MSSEAAVLPEAQKEKIFEYKRLGFTFKIVVSADGLVCSCLYEPSPAGTPITDDLLTQFLTECKIRHGVDRGNLDVLLTKAAKMEKILGLVLATGDAPVRGEDGVIDFKVTESVDEPEEQVDQEEQGQVDLRKVQSFINVSSGQLIGVILPPGSGTPGKNVFGHTVPPQPGNELKLKVGKQVRLDEDGCSLYAETDGRIFYQGGELSVEDTYTVKGDVDFRVGNINYNGFLEVRGDILDGFSIKATKGIRVLGNIGTCRVESDGDVTLCGMAGQDKGTLYCGGTLTANFLHDTKIECLGNVVVETEVRNCAIRTLGTVRVNKGVLVGGNCVAMGGVEVATVGSPTSVFTRIVVGVNYNDLEELSRLFGELKKVLEEFKLSKDRSNTEELMKRRTAITEGIQALRAKKYDGANPKVNIKKKIFEKVSLTLGNISEEIKEERLGPLSIIVNTVEGGVRFLTMTDLSLKAEEIELFYIQEAERQSQAEAYAEG